MDPTNLLDPTKLASGAVDQAPVLALIWYMLRDLKARLTKVEENVADHTKALQQLPLVEQDLEHTKNVSTTGITEIKETLRSHDKMFKAIWQRVGLRRSDKDCDENDEEEET